MFWKHASVSTFPSEVSREIGKGDAEITKRSTLDVRSKRGSHLKVFYIRDSQVKGGLSGQGRGRVQPLPRGLKPEGLKRRGVENRHTTLNHPSPEGWWDYYIYLVKYIYLCVLEKH